MIARVFFTALVVCLFLYLASSLIIPVIMGAAIAVLLFEPFHYLERKGFRSGWAALSVTLSVTLLIFLPTTILIGSGARIGFRQIRAWKDSPFSQAPGAGQSLFESFLSNPWVSALLHRTSHLLGMEVSDVLESAGSYLSQLALKAADSLGDFVRLLPSISLGMLIMVLSIYFMLVDGRKLTAFLRRNSVFNDVQTDDIFRTFTGICRSVLLASLVSGIAQALIFGVACLVGRVPSAGLIILCVFLGSFVPLVGAAPLTFGLAFYQFVAAPSGTVGVGLLIAAGITALADNLIRPAVLKGGANLHPLLALVALFGGLATFGFAGVFLGPIVAGMAVVMIEALAQSWKKP